MTASLAIHDNRLRDAVPVASSTAAGFDVLNLRDMRTYTFWKPAALPATITIDSGAAKDFDSTTIYGHDLGSKGVTVETRKSSDNFAANDVLVDTHAPADDKPIVRLYANQNSRYTRLRFVNGTPPTIAIAVPGKKLEFPIGIEAPFDPLGYELKGQFNRSVDGAALGKVINFREWSAELRFASIPWAFVRDTFAPAAKAWLDAEPWLFAWNPDAYPKETYHVTIDGRWSAPHRRAVCDLAIPVTGLIP